MLVYLFPILASAASDEASGVVTNVVDGDTFDIRIEKTDPRIIYEIERVRLADVDCPEMGTQEGPPAAIFTTEVLLGKRVWLDIDDLSGDGRDPYERLLAVVYLEDLNGFINVTPFNRLLVDAGFAVVDDYTNNEFDPVTWWTGGMGEIESSPVQILINATAATEEQFVGCKRHGTYHYPTCWWAKKIRPKNEIWFASAEEASDAGYVPCGVCNPP
jgi:micrococcal nuclease